MVNAKPFIKLFKTPLGFYCYDVNTFSMLRITEGMFNVLKGIESNINPKDIKGIEQLTAKGYLSSHRAKKIKHPYTNIIEKYLSHNIRKITLQITQNCNLACKYCTYANPKDGQQRHHNAISMSMEVAKKSIKFLFQHSDNEKEINIGFYGGEPLIEYEKIKELIIYSSKLAKQQNKELSYSLTTNGTLLNSEIIHFFQKHNIRLLISIDGPKDIHDKNRVYRKNGIGSFDVVMNKIEYIKKNHNSFLSQISINSVIDPENRFSCYTDFFTGTSTFNDVKISTNQINKNLLATEYKAIDSYLVEYKYEKFKLLLALVKELRIMDISLILQSYRYAIEKIAESFSDIRVLGDTVHHGGPCIVGSLRLFIDVYGNFFPCERCSEKSSILRIGNIDNGFNFEAVKKLINIGELTISECLDCWNIRHCLVCAVNVDGITHFSKSKKLIRCKSVKNSTLSTILDYFALREHGYDPNEILE